MIIPLLPDLRLSKLPVVVISVSILCLFIHYCVEENRSSNSRVIEEYCESIYDETISAESADILRMDIEYCSDVLYILNQIPNKQNFYNEWLDELINDEELTEEDSNNIIEYTREHYEVVRRKTAPSLMFRLAYSSSTIDYFRMITSSITHADWEHVIFNLLFFVAFAAALEILIDHRLKFIGIMVVIALVDGIAFKFTSIIIPSYVGFIYTVGLSGVVMGMIGLSAYLMPKARITVCYLDFFLVPKRFYIPTWFLAIWFIGWDSYYLFFTERIEGVNIIAHVAGGYTGYLLGLFYFKQKKEDIKDEIDDEVRRMKCQRADKYGMLSSYIVRPEVHKEQIRQDNAKKEWARFEARLHKLVSCHSDSDAIVMLLDEYDVWKNAIDLYEELFHEIGKWRKARTYYSIGRLLIHHYIEKNAFGKALIVARTCYSGSLDFVLGDPKEVLLLANKAVECNQDQLAYQIIRDWEKHYGEYVYAQGCRELVKLLTDSSFNCSQLHLSKCTDT